MDRRARGTGAPPLGAAKKGAEHGLHVARSAIDRATQMDSVVSTQGFAEVGRHFGAPAEDHVLVEIVVAGAGNGEWSQGSGCRQHLVVQPRDLLATTDRVGEGSQLRPPRRLGDGVSDGS